MATDPGGNYVDENSDYSFLCAYCKEWFGDIDTEGKHIPEIPGDLCHDCFSDYKDTLIAKLEPFLKEEIIKDKDISL